jgi:hypothetical protein
MNRLSKIATLSILAIGLAAGMAHAEKSDWQGPQRCDHGWQHRKPDPERMARHMEKRLARLHGALKLSPAQEPAWKSFVDKSKPQPMAARPDFEALSKLPTPERLDRMQALSKERQERMAARAAAVKAFYAQLNSAQQKLFDEAFMKSMRGGRHGGENRGYRPD